MYARIGAFITAGMLPRLQSLHQRSWVVTILATNSAPELLDDAVKRPGRFDYLQSLGHPVLDAQLRYIKRKLEGIQLQRMQRMRFLENTIHYPAEGRIGETQAQSPFGSWISSRLA